jgi:hypothetical protein
VKKENNINQTTDKETNKQKQANKKEIDLKPFPSGKIN